MADLRSPAASRRPTIAILDSLLSMMAAEIVGTLVFLITLDEAQMSQCSRRWAPHATTLLTSITLHGLVLSLASLVVGVAVSAALAHVRPFGIRLRVRQQAAKVGRLAVVHRAHRLPSSVLDTLSASTRRWRSDPDGHDE